MITLTDILFVGCGGALGSISRYCFDAIKIFPVANHNTVAINLTGCLLIGILWAVFDKTGLTDSSFYRLIVTGVLGGFTTFSTFALQPVNMFRSGNIFEALLYITISVIGGLLLCWLGIISTQKIINTI